MKKKTNIPRLIGVFILIFYLMILADVLFMTRADLFINPFAQDMSIETLLRGSINLKPFHTIRGYVRVIRQSGVRDIRSYAVQNLYGNLLLFLPMGCLLPMVFRRLRTFPRTFLVTAAIVVLVEITQLATRTGSCDIDDVLLNLTGCAAGYMLYRICSLFVPALRRTKPEKKTPPDPYAEWDE